MTKYVGCMGGIWRMSNRNYRKMLLQLIDIGEVNCDDFGKYIGDLACDVTDMTAEEAEDKLE